MPWLIGVAFLAFGFLAALAYLAYHQEKDLLAYGLGGVALAAAFNGVELLIGAPEGPRQAFSTLFAILRFIAMGGGLGFLAFTAAAETKRFLISWKAQRDAELEAVRAGLRLDAHKDAEPRRTAALR